MPQAPKRFSGIFISYRREDSAGHAGRVFDRLSSYFGQDNVFMDIDHLEPGEDFVQVIEDAVGSCGVLIAIIGRQWLSSAGRDSRRLDNPLDFVRLEIAAALSRNIRVIPILVQGASMPKPQDLPENLSKLTRRHALELSDLRWKYDVDKLVSAIEKALLEHQALSKEEEEATHRKAEDEEERRSSEAEAQRRQEEAVRGKAAEDKEPTPKRSFLIIGGVFVFFVMVVAVVWFIWSSAQPEQPARATLPPREVVTAETNNKVQAPDGMVYVPGGQFTMGRDANDGGDEYERPAHRVLLKPFFMDLYEVTREDYKKCVEQRECPQPQGWTKGSYPEGTGRQPVTGVDWNAANAYAKWVKKRLPTEEEWEFAARGTDRRLYPWGNDWQQGLANANGAFKRMLNVDECKDKSPYGAFGMVGNAWEWTSSPLTAYPGGKLPSKSTGDERVIRGGRYLSNEKEATTTFRGFVKASGERYDETGFRCVLDIKPN